MKRIIVITVVFLSLSLAASAQQQHFSLSGSAVSFMGPSGSTPASIADGYFNLTKSLSLGYQQITIPDLATARLGLVNYAKPLSSWLGKSISSKLVFDASKITVSVYGGAGKLTQNTLSVNRIAETAGACVSYPISANVSAKIVCAQWLHGGIVNGVLTSQPLPGTTANASNAVVSSGITVHF
jgi:hypothetical protein